MTRSVLARLHRWIGLVLALPLILQALTGLIMMADPFTAAIQGVPSPNGTLTEPQNLRYADVAGILAAARSVVPADLEPQRWRALPDAIVAVDFVRAGHPQVMAQVAIDVASTAVLWSRQNPDRFYRWVHALHETLFIGPAGRTVVGIIGICLLFLALLGIPLWWPPRQRWKTGFTVSRNATGWRFQRELHGAAGIWMMGLLLLQSISGIAMAFPQTARSLAGLSSPNVHVSGTPVADPARSIAAGLASAQAVFPAAIVQDVRLPGMPGRPMMAILLPPGDWQGAPRAFVSMDPVTARVLSVRDPAANSIAASVLDWLRAIHEGGAAGPLGRLVMCVFGVALPLLPITGVAMWTLSWRRRRGLAAASSRALRSWSIPAAGRGDE